MLRKLFLPIILVWTLALGLFLAWNDSMTTDEGIHVASAYLAIKRHEFRFDPEHPFLFKYATALPLLAMDLNNPSDDAELWAKAYPTTYDSWPESRRWAEEWFYASGNDARLMIFLSRIPGVLCLVGLCWLAYYLGTLWFSKRIAAYVLLFTAFNPTLLGHGHLTNTDVPLALASLGVVWGLWKYYERPSYVSASILGLLFAIAQVTKFSAVILAPILVLWLIFCVRRKGKPAETMKHFGLIILITLAVIWLVYLMPLYLLQGAAFDIKGPSQLPAAVHISDAIFQKFILIRYILPVDYAKGLSLVIGGSIDGRGTYLLGHAYGMGVWYYFPTLYLLKTQLTGLILMFAGLGIGAYAVVKQRVKPQPVAVLLLLVAGVIAASSVTSKLNLGIRHISPLLPLASFAMAVTLSTLEKGIRLRWFAPLMLATYCLSPFGMFPHFIEYTNIFVQPGNKAWWYFNDSNLDWGQQSKDIADIAENRFSSEPIYVKNYIWSPYALEYYGATVRPLDTSHLPPGGLAVVTATQLSWDQFAWFRDQEPVVSIGGSTFFYRIPCSSPDDSEACFYGHD